MGLKRNGEKRIEPVVHRKPLCSFCWETGHALLLLNKCAFIACPCLSCPFCSAKLRSPFESELEMHRLMSSPSPRTTPFEKTRAFMRVARHVFEGVQEKDWEEGHTEACCNVCWALHGAGHEGGEAAAPEMLSSSCMQGETELF